MESEIQNFTGDVSVARRIQNNYASVLYRRKKMKKNRKLLENYERVLKINEKLNQKFLKNKLTIQKMTNLLEKYRDY